MRTIIVDDELLMMQMFEDECANMADIQIVGKFNKPLEALKFAGENKIELAFLDVEMPKMNGVKSIFVCKLISCIIFMHRHLARYRLPIHNSVLGYAYDAELWRLSSF